MAPAMKAMKAKAMKSRVLTRTQAIASVAETNGLKNKQVKGVTKPMKAISYLPLGLTPFLVRRTFRKKPNW